MLLLLIACTEPLWYPQPPEFSEGGAYDSTDTGAPDTEDLPCSSSGVQAVDYTVTNTTNLSGVVVYWRDTFCAETPYFELNAGGSQNIGTYVGHVWVARDSGGRYLDHTTVRDGQTLWEIGQ